MSLATAALVFSTPCFSGHGDLRRSKNTHVRVKEKTGGVMKTLTKLTDNELLTRTQVLRSKEQKLLLELLLHIAAVDKRKLYRNAGYSSLYRYMIEGLEYSESASHRRIQVARAVSEFPELYDALR